MTTRAATPRLTARVQLGDRTITLHDGSVERFRSFSDPISAVREAETRGLVFRGTGTAAEPLASLPLAEVTAWIRDLDGGDFAWPEIVAREATPETTVDLLTLTLSGDGYLSLGLRLDLSADLVAGAAVVGLENCFTGATLGFGVSYQARPEELPVVRVADDLKSLFGGI